MPLALCRALHPVLPAPLRAALLSLWLGILSQSFRGQRLRKKSGLNFEVWGFLGFRVEGWVLGSEGKGFFCLRASFVALASKPGWARV